MSAQGVFVYASILAGNSLQRTETAHTSLPTVVSFSTSAAVKVDMDTDLQRWLNSRLG